MFCLASSKLAGRTVLVIEPEQGVADILCRAVVDAGGNVEGEAADCFRAMAILGKSNRVDCVVVDVAVAIVFPEPIVPLLSAKGIEVIFVVFDDYQFTNED